MQKENTYYTLDDLLKDEQFISFVHEPSEENTLFWRNMIREGKLKREDYELACYYIQTLIHSNDLLLKSEIADMWDNIQVENKRPKKRTPGSVYLIPTVAATVAVLIGLFLFLAPDKEAGLGDEAQTAFNISQLPKPDYENSDIQLLLSDNSAIAIKENNAEISYDEKGKAQVNSRTIEESTNQTAQQPENAYNQVVVPKGRHSSLLLADGTRLSVNAASRVIYPAVFAQDKREVYLEGEAYLEVKPDKQNRPFIVRTNKMQIKVLGTSFNICAYNDEDTQTVVLVEGLVTVTVNEKESSETYLKPNELLSLNGNRIVIEPTDVNKHISWKNGFYQYEKERLSHILKCIGNYYGVKIEYDSAIGEMNYSGKLDLKEDIERVLNGLCHTAPIRYEKRNEIHYLSLKQ